MTAKLDGLWIHELAWREPLDVARAFAERPGFAFLDSAMFEPTPVLISVITGQLIHRW